MIILINVSKRWECMSKTLSNKKTEQIQIKLDTRQKQSIKNLSNMLGLNMTETILLAVSKLVIEIEKKDLDNFTF